MVNTVNVNCSFRVETATGIGGGAMWLGNQSCYYKWEDREKSSR